MKPPVFSQTDIEILGKKSLYQGFFSMDEYTFKHKLFAGGWSKPVTREVFERGHAVVVLPYDAKQDKVVLIEQVRFPALATAKSPWLLELVAGMIAPAETPLDVAHRELMEETGLMAKQIHSVNSYLASPGGSTERFYFYWADVDSNDARGLHGLAEEHEDIRLHVMSREQAYERVVAGEIDNASTVIGLQWLQLNYQQLV
ncbi:ADP-ribose diphosphatase [Shewanella sp. NKUCC05_KAH]|jgi:ADP-ribose pyrophosphatase|uniref:ADP-ribose pyrophosphatase n=1 Tax=Shewanella oncorhynchi TaxID=2726434 RepID=A0ABX1KVY9_9GAMM|nr:MULTISPECIES: ADP-ribose diphosphatase [Shewanella]GCF89832.1 ADP-ribose pyrophosphatase [Shewanella sp. M-Br]AVI66558.1 ADP-ribose diphosphatase [Shewanella sp. WE21]MBI1676566.1 ADP-ribose diphosphatase [Shewanella sp. DW31]MBP6517662.1 ADP-ribose diphosphatase [Shewanella sp.]MBP7662850.1 ADP-ribose diphosphatase [Shewanella sp.]